MVREKHPIRQGPGSEQASIDLSQLLNEWLGNSGANGLYRTCGSCRAMERIGSAFCKKFDATPPVDTILNGCDAHEDESELPFTE